MSNGRGMVQNGLWFMHSVSYKYHVLVLLSMKLLPFPVNQSFFPVSNGQVHQNSIKTHSTSCYVTGESIPWRYFLKTKKKRNRKLVPSQLYYFIYSITSAYIHSPTVIRTKLTILQFYGTTSQVEAGYLLM